MFALKRKLTPYDNAINLFLLQPDIGHPYSGHPSKPEILPVTEQCTFRPACAFEQTGKVFNIRLQYSQNMFDKNSEDVDRIFHKRLLLRENALYSFKFQF